MPVAAPTVHVYVGFVQGANPNSWVLGTGALDSTTVLGALLTYTYTDVGDDVRSFSTQRGKSKERDQYQAGTARIVLENRARDYDPLNLSGPYVDTGVTLVKPGKPVYITLEYGSVEYTIFTGRIRDWQLDYSGSFDGTATILASDAFAEMNTTTVDLTTSASDTGTNATEVMIDAEMTAFTSATGQTVTQAMTFTGTVLAALRTLEQSEQGALYVEANGDVTFSSRTALQDDPRSNSSQGTFTGSGVLQYTDISIAYESDNIRNSAKVTRQGGAEQAATNQDSIDAYGVKTYSLTGLANVSDASALALAEYIVGRYGDPNVRIVGIELAPRYNATVMVQALTRRIRDRVTVGFAPVGGGSAISQEAHIIGIKHDWDQGGKFTTSFSFESIVAAGLAWRLGYGALDDTTVLTF